MNQQRASYLALTFLSAASILGGFWMPGGGGVISIEDISGLYEKDGSQKTSELKEENLRV